MTDRDSPIMAARRKRLREWIDAQHGGVQAQFQKAIGINQGELSGLLNSKSFGEKKAMAIEVAAAMPDGYLTRPLDPAEPVSQSARIDREKMAEAIEVAMAMRGPLTAQKVADAYELLVRQASVAVIKPKDQPPRDPKGPKSHGVVEGRGTGTGAHSGRASRARKK